MLSCQGPPGNSIRGPVGPPGPPGPPGPAVVSARSHGVTEAQVILGGAGGGQCGCNESLVEGVIMSLASVLPKGDRGQVGIPGKPGLTGATGPRGTQGDIGAPGGKGERGERGETGHRSAANRWKILTFLYFLLVMSAEVTRESRVRKARLAVTGRLASMAEQGCLGPRDLQAS